MPKNSNCLRRDACYDAGMSPEMYTIVTVGVALAALILNGQRGIWELRKEIIVLRKEIAAVSEKLAVLTERVARLEGVILGPRDFARESGAGNTA